MCDLKTAKLDESLVAKYWPQLSPYTLALENPDNGRFGMAPISAMGLLVLEPGAMFQSGTDYGVTFSPRWTPAERDDDAAFQMLGDILGILESPRVPEPGDKCAFCALRNG